MLIDPLWPRGESKDEARIDLWVKELAPRSELRRWFAHRPERWPEFRTRYLDELRSNPAVDELRAISESGPITLVYDVKDREHNDSVVLEEFLNKKVLKGSRRRKTEQKSRRERRRSRKAQGSTPR